MRRTIEHMAAVFLYFAAGILAAFAQPQVSAVTNAADYTLTLSPGAIATIFGTNMAPSAMSASTTPLPTILNTVSVLVAGQSAPLIYVSPGQINFEVPFEVSSGVRPLTVTSGSQKGKPFEVVVADFSPVFSTLAAGMVSYRTRITRSIHPRMQPPADHTSSCS